MLPPSALAESGRVRYRARVQGRCVVDQGHRLRRPPQGLFTSSRPTFKHVYSTPTVGLFPVRHLRPAPSAEPALSAVDYFRGETARPKLVSLEDCSISSGAAPVSLPPASTPAPAKTTSALPPAPIVVQEVAPAPTPTPVLVPMRQMSRKVWQDVRLMEELREARAMIRTLEL